jgi:hypothetical protein
MLGQPNVLRHQVQIVWHLIKCVQCYSVRLCFSTSNTDFLSQLRAQANHAKEQASHSKARVKKVATERKLEHQRFEEEILRFRKDFENLKTHYESEIQALKDQHQIQIDANDANEGQMAEHILQSETERRRMHAEIVSLV